MADIFDLAKGGKPKKSKSVFDLARGGPQADAPAPDATAPMYEPRSISDIAAATPLREAGMQEADAVSQHYADKFGAERAESERKMALIDLTTAFMQEWLKSGRTAEEFQQRYDITNPDDFQNMLEVVRVKAQRDDFEFERQKTGLAVRDIAGEGVRAATGVDLAAEGSSPELMARSRADRSAGRDAAAMVMGLTGAVSVLSPAQRALRFFGRTGASAAAFALHGAGTTAVSGGTAGEVAQAAGSGAIQGAIGARFPGQMGKSMSAAKNLTAAGLRAGTSNAAGYMAGQLATGGDIDSLEIVKQFGVGGVLRMASGGAEARMGAGRRKVVERQAERVRVAADEVRLEEARRAEAEAASIEAAKVGAPLPEMRDAEGKIVRTYRGAPGEFSTEALLAPEPAPAYDPLIAPEGSGAPRGMGGARGGYSRPAASADVLMGSRAGMDPATTRDILGAETPILSSDSDGAGPARSLVGDPEAGYAGVSAKGTGRGSQILTPAWWRQAYGQGSEFVRDVFGHSFKRVAGRGGDAGNEIVADGQRAIVKAADYRARVAPEATEARRASSGGMGRDGATRANADAQAVAVEGKAAAKSRFRQLIEDDATPRTKAEARLKDAWQKLLGRTWNVQAEMGFARKNKAGAEEPMRPIVDGRGRVLPYMGNERLSEILDTGTTHHEFPALLEAVMELNPGKSAEAVKAHLLKRFESAKIGMSGAEGHMASEMSRDFIMPDFIRSGGGWVPIMEVNPFRAVDALVVRGSHVVGAEAVFGRLSKNRVGELRKKYLEAGGRVEDFNASIRTLYGMSPTPHAVRYTQVDTAGGNIKSGFNALAGLARALTQTGSAAWNVAEFPLGNATLFNGPVNQALGIIDTVADFVSRISGRGHTDRFKGLIRAGIKTENVADKSRDVHANAIRDGIDRFSRMMTEVASKPIEEGQEGAAGSGAARKMLKVMEQIGKFTKYRRERIAGQLQVYADLSRQDAIDFLEGTMEQGRHVEVFQQIMARVVPSTTASNLVPGLRSSFESSPWTRTAFKFYRWASNNLRTSAKTLEVGIGGTFRKGATGMERAASLATTADFVAMKALQGAAANLLVALVLGKEGAFKDELEKMFGNPAQYFTLAAFTNAVAGPLGALAKGAAEGNLAMRAFLPVQIGQDFIAPPIKAAKRLITGDAEGAGMELGAAAERAIPPLRGFSGGAMTERLQKKDAKGRREERRGMGRGGR